MTQPPTERATRRRVALSLRFWLAGLTLVGMTVGTWAIRAKRQHDAVTALEELEGSVYYADAPSWIPERCVEAFEAAAGPDYLRGVHTALPPYPHWQEATPHLKRMSGLEKVWFYTVPEDFKELKREMPGVEVTGKLWR